MSIFKKFRRSKEKSASFVSRYEHADVASEKKDGKRDWNRLFRTLAQEQMASEKKP